MVRRFAEQKYPEGLDAAREADEDGNLPASDAALHFRDAKRGSARSEVILFRGRPGTEITRNGTSVPIGELTQSAGVGAALLEENTTLEVDLPLAVVENQEAFLRFDELGTAAELACFAGGRLSSRMLKWLGSLEIPLGQIIHCPDYDPVGLSEFQRLRSACGEGVCLFWPDRLETLIEKYGKADLYKNSSGRLAKLSDLSHPRIQEGIMLLNRYGRGLEQEVLLNID
jgi:hypothetical protein